MIKFAVIAILCTLAVAQALPQMPGLDKLKTMGPEMSQAMSTSAMSVMEVGQNLMQQSTQLGSCFSNMMGPECKTAVKEFSSSMVNSGIKLQETAQNVYQTFSKLFV